MSDRSFNLSGPLQKVFSAILCYAILLSWNHMYAQTEEKNDGTAKEAVKEEDIPEVKIKIFPSKVETNDVLFLKVRFINSTDKTINGSAPYTIFGDYFYVWLKRPRKSQFQEIQPVKEKIHWLGTGGIDIQPEEEFVRYYLLAWGNSGVITTKPGNYKLKVSSTNFNREYQGGIENFGKLESSSISYKVTDGNAISTELLQKHESFFRPYYVGMTPLDQKQISKAQELKSKIGDSVLKTLLEWSVIVEKFDQDHSEKNKQVVQKKLSQIRNQYGTIPYESALMSLHDLYYAKRQWGKARNIMKKLLKLNPNARNFKNRVKWYAEYQRKQSNSSRKQD